MAHNGGKRRLFAAHLATGKTIPEAAALVGISERTAWRWARAPDIMAETRRLQDEALGLVCARLRDGATAALGWLETVGADPTATHAARVSAARAWLDATLGYCEHVELEARIAALERRLTNGNG